MGGIRDIVTVDWVKKAYGFGFPYTDDDGFAFPDALWEITIESAIDTMEAEFGVELANGVGVFTDRHDVTDRDGGMYFLKRLNRHPVQEILSLEWQWADWPGTPLPISWIQLREWRIGQFQILPGQESAALPLQVGLPYQGLGGWSSYTPGLYTTRYRAGFEEPIPGTLSATVGTNVVTGVGTSFLEESPEGEVVHRSIIRAGRHIEIGGEIHQIRRVNSDTSLTTVAVMAGTHAGVAGQYLGYPPAMLDAVGLAAYMLPGDTQGDLIVGAGIANTSCSFDGLSTSIGTTSSATNAGLGAKLINYSKRLKARVALLHRHWTAPEIQIL